MNRRSALARIAAALAALVALVAAIMLPWGRKPRAVKNAFDLPYQHVNRGNIFADWNQSRGRTRKHWTQEDVMREGAFAMQRKFKADVEAGRYDA